MKFFSCIAFFVMGCNPTLFAQLCTGSLGDPLINITFGFGANPGSAVDARQTDYNYSSKSCPGQNEYSITNLSFGCFDNSWFQLTGDHTPFDERGYYMLVNAESTGEKNIFVYTAENLCANTTYELATWIANVLRPGSCNKNGTD
ncbi:MAG TPA: hypothetical protein VF610_07765, partial [Segetibacter sp.]